MKIKNFTLLELLMVIVLIGMMLAVGLPVFNSLTKGNAVNQAGSELSGKLNQARVYALQKNCYVAMLFTVCGSDGILEGSTASAKNQNLYEYMNAAYRPALVYKDDGNYYFKSWLPDSSWTFLPAGIIIPPGTANFGEQTGTALEGNEVPKIIYGVEMKETYQSSGTLNIDFSRSLIFAPDGKLVSTENRNYILRLAEAVPQVGQIGEGTFKFLPTQKEDSKVYYTVMEINPMTGKAFFKYSDSADWN